MSAVIDTRDLTKFYGQHLGVEGLDLEVQEGEVFGYLGPNGAGKTTTIRLLLDFIRPTRGRARVLGLDAQRDSVEIRRHLGYLPGELALYGNLRGMQLLRFLAHLRGGVDWAYVDALAERFELDITRRVREYSRGNKQKLGIIQAFMHRPRLLVLDEPTVGLDPFMQQEFYRLVKEVQAAGSTVFFSSHILPEVERVCTRVGIIRNGSLVEVQDIATMKERALRQIEFRFAGPIAPGDLDRVPGVTEVVYDGRSVCFTVQGRVDAVIKAAAAYTVEQVISHEVSLEAIFMAYYEDGAAKPPPPGQ
ncbi:MAG: ABC transporter ATP-binding protein [Anaerolineae bacterium]